MASFRDMKNDSYFRINYDNDYFSKTDRNYTQGYSFELVSKKIKKNPLNYILIKPKQNNEFKYGVAIEHIGYTANYIERYAIQYGDRPFAAAIMLKSFLIATDTVKKRRIVSSFNIGVIGSIAFGNAMQTAIHEATGNIIPHGWHNQISNDVVLNYQIDYEQQLFRYKNIVSLQANSSVKLGTLFSNASLGFNTTFGLINAPFSGVQSNRKFQLYGYVQPLINAIAYDATLQGGLINKQSPYTISVDHVKRFTAQSNVGIVLQTRKLYLEYSRAIITREFELGTPAGWGGIKIGVKF